MLFEIAVKGTTYPKAMGNLKKQNFDLPTLRVGMLRGDKRTQRFDPARASPTGWVAQSVTKSQIVSNVSVSS